MVRIILWLPAVQCHLTVETVNRIVGVGSRAVGPSRVYHLLHLALPAAFAFMWPGIAEGGASSFHHALVERVLVFIIHVVAAVLDAHVDGPAAVGDVSQVLEHGTVSALPVVQILAAEEAFDVVMAVWDGLEVESRVRKLQKRRLASAVLVLCSTETYLFSTQRFVRPFDDGGCLLPCR